MPEVKVDSSTKTNEHSVKEIPIEEQIEKVEVKLKEPTLAKEQRQKLEQQLEALYVKWLEGGTAHA